MPALQKVLVANRGEIAVRVIRTCRVLGIGTVAVYSDADADAFHLREADEAVRIGPPEAAASYLAAGPLIDAARRTGCDAVHPGYGFLSQNGDFADAVADAGLVFVGPPGEVHRAMGDKKAARRRMAEAGVPVVPGYEGDDQADAVLAAEAARIGFPVMIKPSRGGGGKGMRVAADPPGFAEALPACRREARAAFGDDTLVLERFLARPRHIEVQVLGDRTGRVVHLYERECSIQRRHQKVVEEAPSPAPLAPEVKAALLAAGAAAAQAVGYVGAGTVEFLVDGAGGFHFLEMNTRLQVEHPVTEMVTGLDIVRLQLEIAAGRPITFDPADHAPRGHALECRVYAEDPEAEDRPSPGRIAYLATPQGPGLRVDTGVESGSAVPPYYDPLLFKLVAWGAAREEAIAQMAEALTRTVVLGVATNVARLHFIVSHPAFRAGDLHTRFLAEHAPPAHHPAPPEEAVAAALAALAGGTPVAGERARVAPDPWTAGGRRLP